jgi:hypothetical protein
LSQRRQRRDDGNADMAFGGAVAVMAVEIVGLGGGGIGCAGDAHAPAVEQHARRKTVGIACMEQGCNVAANLPGLHRRCGRRYPQRIEKEI